MPLGLAKAIVGMGSEEPSKEAPAAEPDRFDDLAVEMIEAFEAKDPASLATLLRAIAGEGSTK